MVKHFFHWGGLVAAVLALAGCATYRPEPLAKRPNLAPSVATLDRTIPAMTANDPPVTLEPTQSFSIDQVGMLAILNDPDLVEQRGDLALARADVTTASTLPNPSISLGFAALIYGPPGVGASTPSYAASLSQDITSLITYHARVAAAKASFKSVNASLLWQEWQVAQKARLLAVNIYYDDAQIRYLKRELSLLSTELTQVRQATAQGNLDLSAEAPLDAATATAQTTLATARLTQLKDWQQLDALLGLEPSVRFGISEPELTPPPADLAPLVSTLPERRPDLVALQLGYQSSEEKLRAAVLAQFPALSLGPSGGTDTSNVLSIGPTLTMDLPIFNRNQGGIASAKATREVLHAQYQAALDQADGTIHGLTARIAVLSADLVQARAAAAAAQRVANNAENAYGQGNLDQRSLVDYQTTALERQLDVISYQTQLDTDQLDLAIELGVGLPQTRLTNHTRVTPS